MPIPGRREHAEALEAALGEPIRVLTLARHHPGWLRAGVGLLDALLSAGTIGDTEMGPFYAVATTDRELVLARVVWRQAAFRVGTASVVIEQLFRHPVTALPSVELDDRARGAVVLRVRPHPEHPDTDRPLELAFFDGVAPGFDDNVAHARWIYEQTRESGAR